MTLILRSRYDADAGELVKETKRGREELGRFKKSADSAGKSAEGAARKTDKFSGSARKAGRSSRSASRDVNAFDRSLRGVKSLIGGIGIGIVSREILQTGLGLTSTTARFRSATGGIKAGADEMENAAEIADFYGQRLQVVEQGYSGLLAASRGTGIEDQARDIFEGVATAATALQLPAEQTGGALRAIEQIMSKGSVQAEELRGQLGERIPGAFQIAARAMGVTTAELSKMLELGQVASDDFLPKFARQLKIEFGESAVAAADEAGASVNRFFNGLTDRVRDLSSGGLMDEFAVSMERGTDFLTDPATQEAAAQFSALLGGGLGFITDHANDLSLAIGGLVAAKFAGVLIGWGSGALSAARNVGILRAATAGLGGPLGVAALAIAALPFLIESNDERLASMERTLNDSEVALDAYASASRKAAEQQELLGGKVSDTTQKMLEQSRAGLQDQLVLLQSELDAAFEKVSGFQTTNLRSSLIAEGIKAQGGHIIGALSPLQNFDVASENPERLGAVFGDLVEMMDRLNGGEATVLRPLYEELARISGVGEESANAAAKLNAALNATPDVQHLFDLDEAVADMLRISQLIGGLEAEIAAVQSAPNEVIRGEALQALAFEITRLSQAGEVLRSSGGTAFRDILSAAGATQEEIDKITSALDGTLEVTQDVAATADDINFDNAISGASALTGEIERANRALKALRARALSTEIGNVGLEAQLSALKGGADRADAILAGKLAESRASVGPLIAGPARRPGDGLPSSIEAPPVIAELQREQAGLETRVSLEREINAILKDRKTTAGGGGGRTKAELTALQEAVKEFGDRFGGTFKEAEQDILEWRESAMADLRAVGLGHGELADKVDAVTRARIADAYREDLANRDDWRAGVERAMDDIAGSHETMADRAEGAIKTALSGAEDAFVQFAKTGKIQTQDLVDFALRQLFRLAMRLAQGDLTGGGGGGGIISSLIGGLFGGGSGGGSSAAFSLFHEGGDVASGGIDRIAPAALLSGAPKLHSGGLLPGEKAAILEDDERVLTRAQQQSTADTIMGLARLAGSSSGAGTATPNVNVNIYGAKEEPRVEKRKQPNGDLDIDVIFGQFVRRLNSETSRGEGVAPAIAGRFGLRTGGT